MPDPKQQNEWFSQGAYLTLGALFTYTIWLFLRWFGFSFGRLLGETIGELLA